MRQYFFKAVSLVAFIGILGTQAMAQPQKTDKQKLGDNEEIIIRKKGDKNSKITIEINDGEVKVNGKPLAEFNDDDVVIRKRGADGYPKVYVAPRSPYQGGTWNYEGNDGLRGPRSNPNRAFLGVMSENGDDGAKITSVTKGSAAEKAGFKEGDVITRVGDTKIENPEDLSKAIGKFKPEDKVAITYTRNKKEQKATVELSRRAGDMTYFPENFDFKNDFNFDFDSPDHMSFTLKGGSPRLGIKAQDTEDGKGVKVLDVDDGSNAEKAGIKEGDILTSFDGKAVNSATELMEAAKNAKDKNSIRIKFTRGGKSQEVEVKIPKKLKTANL